MKKVTLIPGDGIGPEIVESVKRIFKAANVQVEWEEMNAGISVMDDYGTPLPEHVLMSIRKNKVALKAPLTTPVGTGIRSVNVQLRKELDLYANVRPIRTFEGISNPLKSNASIDMVIVRENTEGLYAGIEHMAGKDAASTIRVITRDASKRIAEYAAKIAYYRKNKNVTIVHKANIMKKTDGMFLNVCKDVLSASILVTHDDKIIDNMTMQLLQRPETFSVIVCPNFHGDIISDLAAGLVGGLGVAPGANIGDDCAVYEAIHGTAPDIAGKGIANPTSLLLSACMMLRDENINDHENADKIENAIKAVFKEGVVLTGDLGGIASTDEFTNAIIAKVMIPAV